MGAPGMITFNCGGHFHFIALSTPSRCRCYNRSSSLRTLRVCMGAPKNDHPQLVVIFIYSGCSRTRGSIRPGESGSWGGMGSPTSKPCRFRTALMKAASEYFWKSLIRTPPEPGLKSDTASCRLACLAQRCRGSTHCRGSRKPGQPSSPHHPSAGEHDCRQVGQNAEKYA